MTKTKFKADIHKTGSRNSNLLAMVAAHNEGREILSIGDFISYASNERAIFNIKNLEIFRDADDENKVLVTEDNGKTFTIIIEEVIVYELENANDPDDMKNVL